MLHCIQQPLGAVNAAGAPLPYVLCPWGWDTLSILSCSLREEGHRSCTPSCSRCPHRAVPVPAVHVGSGQ